ncbi:MAG: transposase, partial [Eubacteriaceae bacterium]|nr:transposase [Eubacteriaceae bacterium]
MMTPTEYDPTLLDELKGSLVTSEGLEARMSEFLSPFAALLRAKSQRLYFGAYIRGLLSPLDRKSVEPIALRMLGEKGVRPMQQLLARSPLPEPQLEGLCRSALAGIASAPGGMLSCD